MPTKLKAGKYKIPVDITKEGERLVFNFPYNKTLMNEIKMMQGRKYHGFDEENPRKVWSIPICERNLFQLAYLSGKNPYSRYDNEVPLVKDFTRPVYKHQIDMVSFGLHRRQCIFACEMGTGKTLAAIEIMERSQRRAWLWVGPKATIPAIQYEFKKWKAEVTPEFMTYDRLRILNQQGALGVYEGVIFDESTKVKTPTALRSKAAYYLTESMRLADRECFIILMSGAPAPRAPTDWWHQCEVACPGFLIEGDIHKFKNRLAIIVEKESIQGGTYPELVAWLDDERKCKICGKYPDEHDITIDLVDSQHGYQRSTNEVYKLSQRLEGLVLIKRKKDCLDLPELQFREVVVKAEPETLRAMSLIKKTAARAIEALILLREISDGFQYSQEPDGQKDCHVCNGGGQIMGWVSSEGTYNPDLEDHAEFNPEEYTQQEIECPNCKGTGMETKYKRVVEEVPCPKDQVVIDELDAHEDIGRLVIYAGFQGSVDRCVKLCLRYKWNVIRVDGRGWSYFTQNGEVTDYNGQELIELFQESSIEKICFVGQPGAAGMGLTLTASPTVVCFSNTYNPEDRNQSINRIHRPGMDTNRGATVVDIIHLPVDKAILEKLEKNQDLEKLTLGELQELIEKYGEIYAS